MFTNQDKLFLSELAMGLAMALTQKQYVIIANLINKYKEDKEDDGHGSN